MKRFIFPIVNAVVVAILFGLVGYYAGNFGLWVVVGALDDFENRVNQRYAALLGEKGEHWVIENAHHVGGAWTVLEIYTARMLDFFEQALLQ